MTSNKEYSKLNGRLTRWGKARQDSWSASFSNNADTLVSALQNLDRKAELVIQSLLTSEDYQAVKAETEKTRKECIDNFAKRYTEDTNS